MNFLASSTLETSETQEEELEGEEAEEEIDETTEETADTATSTTRGQRGVPRRAVRRARGRRAGARVVSTRLHAGRRNAPIPKTNSIEDNNATLEETVNTEAEESPKKIATPVVTEAKTTPSTSTDSNIRVSGKFKFLFEIHFVCLLD